MTQPTGQQPPQEGFGAPYDPPPGPGPYGQQQPGPYGQQQQQPGPYGQQWQGGYGPPSQQYPGGPTPGAPLPPDGPGRFRALRGKPAALIGAALVVLLTAGGGVLLATGGGGEEGPKSVAEGSADPEPPRASPAAGEAVEAGPGVAELNAGRKPGEAKVLWLQRNTVDVPGKGALVHGPWMVGDTVVKGMYRTVSGYALADGTERWSLKLPFEICAVPSRPTADGKIVIGIEASASETPDCSVLQMIDLKTGKPGWKKTVPLNSRMDSRLQAAMSVNDGILTYGWDGGVDAYRISDGKKLFGNKAADGCLPTDLVSGPRMITFGTCPGSPDVRIQKVDPLTGKPEWAYELEPGWSLGNVHSVDPLVVTVTNFEESRTIALRDDGTLRSRIDGVVGGAAAAGPDALYVATNLVSNGSGIDNSVVAYDLDTGKLKWKAASLPGRAMLPLRMEGPNVLVHVQASKEKGGGIATLAPGGGVPKMLLSHPDSAADAEYDLFESNVGYVDGHAVLTRGSVSSGSDEEEAEVSTMMVFGK